MLAEETAVWFLEHAWLIPLIPGIAFAVIILAGGLLVIDGKLSLGGFISYNLYLALLTWPLRMIGMWIGQYQRAVASGERRNMRVNGNAANVSTARDHIAPAQPNTLISF